MPGAERQLALISISANIDDSSLPKCGGIGSGRWTLPTDCGNANVDCPRAKNAIKVPTTSHQKRDGMWSFTDPFWETVFKWATIIAALSGGVGIAAAFVSAWVGYKINDAVQREADRKIAEAQAQSTQAEQERLKTQLAWRRITAEQHNAIVRSLRAHPATILVGHASNDPEATVYAEDIAKTFRDAGWVVNRSVFIGPQPT